MTPEMKSTKSHLKSCEKYRKTHKEQIAAHNKAMYDILHPVPRKVGTDRDEIRRRFYESHPGYDSKRKALWYRTHKEVVKERCSRWAKENPAKVIASAERRRARKMGNGGSYTAEQWQALLEKYGHKCLKCGSSNRLEADHILPLSMGGTSNIRNIQPLCRHCNRSKHATYADYRREYFSDWT